MDFNSIRPYRDDEVKQVIKNLLNNKEFLFTLAKFRFKWVRKWMVFAIYPIASLYLTKKLQDIDSVSKLQNNIKKYLDRTIKSSIKKLTSSGLDSIELEEARIFISNHRDIVLDPALVNYIIYQKNKRTVQIAVGNNLLKKEYISDLMRLNKSFIVKRDAKSDKQKYKDLQELSLYIRQTITESLEYVWIAQREGRSKNGIDKTEESVIKMLNLATRKKAPCEGLLKLKLTPVAISYEFDPCDIYKATELFTIKEQGSYTKTDIEDMNSIKVGIIGYKGRVNVAFCKEIELQENDTYATISKKIDNEIIENFHLMPTHIGAYELLYGKPNIDHGYTAKELAVAKKALLKRCNDISDGIKDLLISSYASPVVSKLKQ